MSPTTGTWKDRAWAKRWMERRSTLERRQEAGEWINCDANCYCCRYLVDEGCVDTDEDANETCPAPGPTPAAAPSSGLAAATLPPASETTTSILETTVTGEPVPESTAAQAPSSGSATGTSVSATSSPSVSQKWVFPAATGSIRARQAGINDAATFGPVYHEDSMIVQWTPEDTTPGIQWFCESNSGSRSGGLVSSNQSQPLRIQFNSLADQANDTDDVYCRLGFTDAPGQTVQWQYINEPDSNGAKVISAPANVATAAVATATSLLSAATTTISTSATSSGESGSGSSGLSTGAAAGIGVGIGIVIIASIILGIFFWRRRKNKGAHRSPVWASSDKKSSNSDDKSDSPYYSDHQTPRDGIYELPGEPVNPTELPAGIKGTAAMPSELHSYEKRDMLAELGSDKDLAEQNIRPRPLAPHPAQFAEDENDSALLSPSDYGTERSAVSPASGTLSSEASGNVSPLRKTT